METILVRLVTEATRWAVLGDVTLLLTEVACAAVTLLVLVTEAVAVGAGNRARGVNVSLLSAELADNRGTLTDDVSLLLAPRARLGIRNVEFHHLDVALGLGVPGDLRLSLCLRLRWAVYTAENNVNVLLHRGGWLLGEETESTSLGFWVLALSVYLGAG